MIPATSRPTRALIRIMMALVAVTIIIAVRYYNRENLSVDPRIVPARELYKQYNILASNNDYTAVFQLLDSIEQIYRTYSHYYNAFELGVLENNRAAVYLTIGLSYDSLSTSFHHLGQDSLIALGESSVRNSIQIYESWQETWSGKNEEQIREMIRTDFPEEKYLQNRTEEISGSINETPRRLSVSYTNLGIVYRYRESYEEAALCYQKAIELWEDNLTAENNLNLLLGRPLKNPNFLQKMFPKPKD